jgi:hypothetical protein
MQRNHLGRSEVDQAIPVLCLESTDELEHVRPRCAEYRGTLETPGEALFGR